MIMSTFKTVLTAATLAMALPLAAEAATLKVMSFDYGNGAGEVNPSGADPLFSDYVRVQDNSSPQFVQAFDFSDLSGSTYDSFVLEIEYTGIVTADEDWVARVLGSSGALVGPEDLNVALTDQLVGDGTTTLTITIDASSDTGGVDAFASSAATDLVRLRFRDTTFGADQFRLHSTTLTVNGTAAPAVPLPASGLLLVGALGGVAAFKRRRKAA